MASTPGYVDIQVNGYGGISYNIPDLTVEKLRDSCQRLEKAGVAGILATVTSEQPDACRSRQRDHLPSRSDSRHRSAR